MNLPKTIREMKALSTYDLRDLHTHCVMALSNYQLAFGMTTTNDSMRQGVVHMLNLWTVRRDSVQAELDKRIESEETEREAKKNAMSANDCRDEDGHDGEGCTCAPDKEWA